MLENLRKQLITGEITDILEVNQIMTSNGFYSEVDDSEDRRNMISNIVENNEFYYTNADEETVRFTVEEVDEYDDEDPSFVIVAIEKR